MEKNFNPTDPKFSRYAVINLMRKKVGKPELIWDRFEDHSWPLIEEITEAARQEYNKAVVDSERNNNKGITESRS